MASLRPSEGVAPEVCSAYNAQVSVRIRFERTGGLAGRKIEVFVDSDSLPPTQAKRLRTLLDRSKFFDLPLELGAGSGGADRFQYRVTVEDDSHSHTVEASESTVPDAMWPLLDWLARHGA